MGRTELHDAAERGESERLQRLLDSGSFNINEGDDPSNPVEREREEVKEKDRERARESIEGDIVSLSSFPSSHHELCAINHSGYGYVILESSLFFCVCTDCVVRLLSITLHKMATVSVSVN
jgi:hypothetical protein